MKSTKSTSCPVHYNYKEQFCFMQESTDKADHTKRATGRFPFKSKLHLASLKFVIASRVHPFSQTYSLMVTLPCRYSLSFSGGSCYRDLVDNFIVKWHGSTMKSTKSTSDTVHRVHHNYRGRFCCTAYVLDRLATAEAWPLTPRTHRPIRPHNATLERRFSQQGRQKVARLFTDQCMCTARR
jgi:hypothetical protein